MKQYQKYTIYVAQNFSQQCHSAMNWWQSCYGRPSLIFPSSIAIPKRCRKHSSWWVAYTYPNCFNQPIIGWVGTALELLNWTLHEAGLWRTISPLPGPLALRCQLFGVCICMILHLVKQAQAIKALPQCRWNCEASQDALNMLYIHHTLFKAFKTVLSLLWHPQDYYEGQGRMIDFFCNRDK